MKTFFLASIAAIYMFTLSSCGGGSDTSETDSSAALLPNHVWLDLSKYGFDVSIQIPDSTIGLAEIVHTNSGAVEIVVGRNFGISVQYGEGDIAMLKEDLKADDVFKSEWLIDEANTLLYNRTIPNTEIETQHHFLHVTQLSNAIFEVRTLDMETYGKKATEDMLNAAKTLKVNAPKING